MDLRSTSYGSTFRIQCDENHGLRGTGPVGENIVTCGADGHWDYGTLHCAGE